jgi:hypothetical protein
MTPYEWYAVHAAHVSNAQRMLTAYTALVERMAARRGLSLEELEAEEEGLAHFRGLLEAQHRLLDREEPR